MGVGEVIMGAITGVIMEDTTENIMEGVAGVEGVDGGRVDASFPGY